jgi:hypothetical protein
MRAEKWTDMERAKFSAELLEALRPGWVQQTFKISNTTLGVWRKGIPPARVEEVVGEVLRRVGQDETPPPVWARELTDEVLDEIRRLRRDLLSREASDVADRVVGLAPELQSSDEGSAGSQREPQGLDEIGREPGS